MAHLRRVLAPLTAIWLLSQVGTVVLVPVALWISGADPHAAECACGHAATVTCPMHHKPTGSARPCAMQAANSSGNAVLTSVVVIAGPISEPLSIRPAILSIHPRPADVHVIGDRPVTPDPPPPRA
jgi:hypothetical protein